MSYPIPTNPQMAERQHFDQAWLYVLSITTLIIPTVLVYDKYSKQGFSWPMLLILIGPLFTIGLLKFMWLDIAMTDLGIHYRFVPFVRWRLIPWANISHVETCRYDPLSDYGGWGAKKGKQGWVYNISGDDGLRITHKDGHILMLGIRDVKGWEAQLKTVGQLG